MCEELPKMIRIMPDYGPSYASDEDACIYDVADCFSDHPRIAEIREIEDGLYGLASRVDSGEADDNPDFPWDELNERGLALTRQLTDILKGLRIPVVYRALTKVDGENYIEEIVVGNS
jgi:hypothetical protein